MRRKRRNHSPEFKAIVALAALRGDRTLAELAEQFNVRPNQIQDWKKRLVESAGDLFARAAQSVGKDDETVAAVHAKIGQLTMENDFLERGLERIHGPRGKKWQIERPNQVWAADVTYVPMAKGFMYLVAIIDWYSHNVLSWRLSNTLDAEFFVEALEQALATYGRPEIFNIDQGSQFTSEAFTPVRQAHDIRISMDGKGRWVDNVFVERLWRSLKYEEIYLKAYDSIAQARASIRRYMAFLQHRTATPVAGTENAGRGIFWAG